MCFLLNLNNDEIPKRYVPHCHTTSSDVSWMPKAREPASETGPKNTSVLPKQTSGPPSAKGTKLHRKVPAIRATLFKALIQCAHQGSINPTSALQLSCHGTLITCFKYVQFL